MKKAKEYVETLTPPDWYLSKNGKRDLEVIIEQAQLEAMKEGARRTANNQINEHWTGEQCKNAIFTTAEQWTEKDL